MILELKDNELVGVHDDNNTLINKNNDIIEVTSINKHIMNLFLKGRKIVLENNNLVEYNYLSKNKTAKIKQLHEKYQNIINSIKAQSAQYEIETWSTQNAEWTKWNIDNATPTPFVDSIATARGISRDALLDKIGNKVLRIATLLGTQQAFEDQIKACTTQAELDAIEV